MLSLHEDNFQCWVCMRIISSAGSVCVCVCVRTISSARCVGGPLTELGVYEDN